MAKKDLNLFLNKGSKSKSTFNKELFKNSSWYPNLINEDFECVPDLQTQEVSAQEAPIEAVVQKSQPVKASISIEKAPKIEKSEEKAPVIQMPSEKEEVVKSDFLFDLNFENHLSQIDSNWKVNDIPGYEEGSQIGALFYGLDQITADFIPESSPFSCIESTHDLLGKMIMAMGLKEGEFVRVPIIETVDSFESLLQAIDFFKPKLVISLGALATNIALGRKLKLSNVHGSFNGRTVNVGTKEIIFNVSPLFHPQLLEINQSMKKTAWTDMQEMMKFISCS